MLWTALCYNDSRVIRHRCSVISGTHDKATLGTYNGSSLGDAKKKTFLLTGSAGFVGSHMLEKLLPHANRIMCMYRNRLPIAHEKIVPFYSDMQSSDLLATPLRDVDTVINLAWSNNFTGYGEEVLRNNIRRVFTSNLRSLRNLLAAMERAKTKRLIFLSARGASLHSKSSFAREKYIAEHYILNSNIPQKIIIRCPVVWRGNVVEQDRFVKSMLRLMRLPAVSFIPDYPRKINLVSIDQLAEQLLQLCFEGLHYDNALIYPLEQKTYKLKELHRMISRQVLSKNKLPIGGALCEAMLPLLEKECTPKIKQYLSVC